MPNHVLLRISIISLDSRVLSSTESLILQSHRVHLVLLLETVAAGILVITLCLVRHVIFHITLSVTVAQRV